jgi:hypothetical protein
MTSHLRRAIYRSLTLGKNRNCFSGHVEGTPYFWRTWCSKRIRHCRSLVYREINTLSVFAHALP